MSWLDRVRGKVTAGATRTAAPPLSPAAAMPVGAPGYVIVDVETTGLSANSHRIVEIAILRTDQGGATIDEWTCRLNPDGPLGASHIHGITAADVAGAPRFAQVLPDITARLRGAAVVAHNAHFDLAFLRAEYARAGWALPHLPALCTLEASFTYLPQLDRRRLVDCCTASGIALHQAHSALGDARATATLLRSYLDPRFGPPPLREHLHLPSQARQTPWPTQPGGVRPPQPTLSPRAVRNMAQPKTQTPALVTVLKRFSLTEALDDGAPPGSLPYLELLADALSDGILDEQERAALGELADMYILDAAAVTAAHRGFLLALAHLALNDGKVSQAERGELHHISELLDVERRHVADVLEAAETARHARLSAGLQPLPDTWTLGQPLHVGDKVVFTGCDDAERDQLEQEATRLGVRVMSGVNARTSMLVTDGSFSGGKAASAAEHRTRQVTPAQFRELLRHLQPAAAAAQVPAQRGEATPAEPSATHSPTPAQPAGVTPSQMRAWAKDNGYDVGVRGRLPAEVVDAYREAHAPAAANG